MSDNIFGSSVPDGLTLSPAANSSDDKYVQGVSPVRSSVTSNYNSIIKSGFYHNLSGTIKNIIHSQSADGSAYQIINDSGSGVYFRTKNGSVWSVNKYIVSREGDQYIQNITTDSITALKIPLSTSSTTVTMEEGIKFKQNTDALLTQSLAVRTIFKPVGVDEEYTNGGYGIQLRAPSQTDRTGIFELNEEGKIWSSYSGWLHRNYINKTNVTTGTFTVDTPVADVAVRVRGDGAGWGTSLEVEGTGDSSDWVTTGTGASVSYHKPGVIRWKQGVATGVGEIWGATEWQTRSGYVPNTTNGQLNHSLSDSGRGWYRSGVVALSRSGQDVPLVGSLEGNRFYGKVLRLEAGIVGGDGAQVHYIKPGQVEWGVGIKAGAVASEGNNFVFQSSGSSTQNGSQTAMIEYSTGRLWTQTYGWLDKKFFNGSSRIQADWFNVGSSNYIEIKVDGVAKGISFFNSDKRLKKNIKNTVVDSLDMINQIEFKSFDYKDDQYESKTNGVIAQQLEKINKEWVNTMSDGAKMPDTNDLLVSALHAIQQLSKKIEELEKKLENK